MKPYSFLQGIDAGKLPPEAENYLREEILKSEAIGQISPDAKEFKNVVELITSRYPDALPKGESEKEVKGVTKEDYRKAIKGLTASIKYLPAGDKQKTQAAIKGLKIAMKYQKMEKGGRMPYSDYEGKTAEEVWDGWPGNQKEHFLSDHHNLWASESYEKRSRIIDSKYTKLPFEIQKLIMAHISAGQYAGGGGMEKGGSMADGVITAEQIWDGWTSNERHNFLKNHNLFPTFYTSDYEYIFNTANSKDTMPDYRVNQIRHAKEVVDTLDKHISGGSMAKGGETKDGVKIIESYWADKKEEKYSENEFKKYIKKNEIKNVWIGHKKIDYFNFSLDNDRMIMRYALRKNAALKYYVNFLNHSVALKFNNAVFLQDANYEDYENKILTKKTLDILNTKLSSGGSMEKGGEITSVKTKLGMKGSVLDSLEDAGYIFDENELSAYFRGEGYKEYNNIKSLVAQNKLDEAVAILKNHIKISYGGSMEKGGGITNGLRWKNEWTDTKGVDGYDILQVMDIGEKIVKSRIIESSKPERVGKIEEETKNEIRKIISGKYPFAYKI